MLAVLAGLAAWGQAASGVQLLDDDGTGSGFRASLRAAPLFSFASPTAFRGYPAYAGLPATDGCKSAASVTGTKGEALTFTRATASSCCTSTDCSTLEQCTSGQVCISPYSGGRGMRVNRGYTQLALRTEETDDAAWTKISGGGPVAPSLDSTDSVVAPDGTTTAEVVTWPAVDGAASYSVLRQNVTMATAGHICVWVKKTGGAGTKLWLNNGGAVGNAATDCAPTASWSRCCVSSTAAGTVNVDLGGNSYITAQGVTPMAAGISAAVWGWYAVAASSYAMPYVKAVGTSVTVNAETASFAAPSGIVLSPLSIAATRVGPATSATQPNITLVNVPAVSASEGSNVSILYGNVNGLRCYNNANIDQRVAFAAATEERAWCDFDHANGTAASRIVGAWPTGSAMADSVTASGGGAAGVEIQVGYFGGAANYQADGIVGNVCADLTLGRCR
jgi:hypothetical protein